MWLFELSLVPKISKTLRTIYLMDRNPILIFVTNLRIGRMSAEGARDEPVRADVSLDRERLVRSGHFITTPSQH